MHPVGRETNLTRPEHSLRCFVGGSIEWMISADLLHEVVCFSLREGAIAKSRRQIRGAANLNLVDIESGPVLRTRRIRC